MDDEMFEKLIEKIEELEKNICWAFVMVYGLIIAVIYLVTH